MEMREDSNFELKQVVAITISVVLSWAVGNVGSGQERDRRLFNLHNFKSDLTYFYIMRGLPKQPLHSSQIH